MPLTADEYDAAVRDIARRTPPGEALAEAERWAASLGFDEQLDALRYTNGWLEGAMPRNLWDFSSIEGLVEWDVATTASAEAEGVRAHSVLGGRRLSADEYRSAVEAFVAIALRQPGEQRDDWILRRIGLYAVVQAPSMLEVLRHSPNRDALFAESAALPIVDGETDWSLDPWLAERAREAEEAMADMHPWLALESAAQVAFRGDVRDELAHHRYGPNPAEPGPWDGSVEQGDLVRIVVPTIGLDSHAVVASATDRSRGRPAFEVDFFEPEGGVWAVVWDEGRWWLGDPVLGRAAQVELLERTPEPRLVETGVPPHPAANPKKKETAAQRRRREKRWAEAAERIARYEATLPYAHYYVVAEGGEFGPYGSEEEAHGWAREVLGDGDYRIRERRSFVPPGGGTVLLRNEDVSDDELESLLEEMCALEREKEAFGDAVQSELDRAGIVVVEARSVPWRISVTRSTYPGVAWQVTRWEGDEPVGHVDASTLESAVDELWEWSGGTGWRERFEARELVRNPDRWLCTPCGWVAADR